MQKNQQSTALSVEEIRLRILAQQQRDPRVRITVQMPHSRLVQSTEVLIMGVYPHVFCVEEWTGSVAQRHSFQYADVLTGRVGIENLL